MPGTRGDVVDIVQFGVWLYTVLEERATRNAVRFLNVYTVYSIYYHSMHNYIDVGIHTSKCEAVHPKPRI